MNKGRNTGSDPELKLNTIRVLLEVNKVYREHYYLGNCD